MPRYRTGLFLVTPEHLHLLAEIPDVEELQQVIPAGGHQPVSIVVPLQVHHGGLVSMSGIDLFIVSSVPLIK